MTRGARRRLIAGLLAAFAAGACGKRGSPLPPLRSVPARVTDLAAHRVDDRVDLSWTVPSANTDGTSPPVVTRIDVYATSTTAAEPAPGPDAMWHPDRLVAQVPVRGADVPSVRGQEPPSAPGPGERATFTERVGPLVAAGAAARHYVAVPMTGSGAGRSGPSSDVVTVPLPATALPDPPRDVTIAFDETTLTVRWQPGAADQRFRVLASGPSYDAATAVSLTSTPLTTAEFTEPVQMGRERCVVVRALTAAGNTTLEGVPTPPVCVTAVDRFPPPAPSDLQAIQDAAAVALEWRGGEAADLAGYVILRGEGAGENMQPLVGEPVQTTSFRDEAVRIGVTYVYAVYAQDRAMPPNVSQLSNRQTVTVR